MLYKYVPLEVIHTFNPPSLGDYPNLRYKYCSPCNIGYCPTYVKDIINKVPKHNYRYTLIDIKVDDLKVGQLPTNPNYHTDLSLKPNDSVHYLFVSGISCTEFVTQDIEVKGDKDQDIIRELNTKCKDLTSIQIEPLKLYKYGSSSIHKATPAYTSGKRLLIRVSFSNTFKPREIVSS